MKKVPLFFLAALTLIGCGKSNQGELVGVKQKKFYPQKPHGMALIPGGSYIMGSSDEDIIASNDNPTQTVTLRSFWMDETEITNAEYMQFVEWVKDSIIRTELAKAALLNGGYFSVSEFPTSDEDFETNPILAYLPSYDMDALENQDEDEKSGYQQYLEENFSDVVSNYYETEDAPDNEFHYHLPLNKDVDIIKDREDYPDVDYARVFEETIYLPEKEWFNGEPAINTKLLKYRFTSVDLNDAIKNPDSARSSFARYEVHEIYPDTTVWIKDFKYSYNEPMHNDYFWHQAYATYPVVGVTWNQARAFAHWRTKMRNDYLRSRKSASPPQESLDCLPNLNGNMQPEADWNPLSILGEVLTLPMTVAVLWLILNPDEAIMLLICLYILWRQTHMSQTITAYTICLVTYLSGRIQPTRRIRMILFHP